MKNTVFALFASLVLIVQLSAQEPGAATEIGYYQLENGLELVVIPDRRAPIVTHMVWYKAGAADDPPGQSGIAHFLEHLMFKGTEKYPAGTLDRMVHELGGNTNAFTGADVTAYFQTVPPDALGEMMAIEADRMRNLVLPPDVIEAERNVVLDERRQRVDANPRAILAEEARATLFQNHPYRIPVIGWEAEIRALDEADALDFYHRFYAPNNALVVVSGDVDPEAVKVLAEQTYGKVERGPNLSPRALAVEPTSYTSSTITLKDARVSLPSFSRAWQVPSYHTAKASGEAEALDLLAAVLSQGSRSRFYREFMVKTDRAAQAGADYSGGAYDIGTFELYGTPRPGTTLEELETAIYAEVDKLIAEGITQTELDRVKRAFLRSAIFQRDDHGAMAQVYGLWISSGRSIEDIAIWPDRIEAVTLEQVQAVAQKYLHADIAVTAYLLPRNTESTE